LLRLVRRAHDGTACVADVALEGRVRLDERHGRCGLRVDGQLRIGSDE
jgi:hypothetical protein